MLKIETNLDGWNGTAALVIAHAIEDILSDGAPFEATLTVGLEYSGTHTFKATIHTLTGAEVTMTSHATGRRVEINTEDIQILQID